MAVITSTANATAKRLRALRGASRRERGGLVLLEGVRLCEDSLAAGCSVALGLLAEDRLRRTPRGMLLADRLLAAGALPATTAVLDSVSDTITSQGLVIAVDEPTGHWPEALGSVLLVLDGIRDPGNVGTILRSAAASGQVRVVLARDCADVWGTKTVRAGMGAHFRLRVFATDSLDVAIAHASDRPWLVADSGGGTPYDVVDWRQDCVLVIGGEAEGASPTILSLASQRVTIPIAAGSESLNAAVAAGVLLFEAARHRGYSHER